MPNSLTATGQHGVGLLGLNQAKSAVNINNAASSGNHTGNVNSKSIDAAIIKQS